MRRWLIRLLLVLSTLWMLLMCAWAWATYPMIGPLIATIEGPMALWDVNVHDGVATVVFHKREWLMIVLPPLGLLWLLGGAAMLVGRPPRGARSSGA